MPLTRAGLVIASASVAVIACGAAETAGDGNVASSATAAAAAQTSGIPYEIRTYRNVAGDCGNAERPAACTRVELTWPEVIAPAAEALLEAINEPLHEWLARPVFEDDGGTPEQIASGLQRAHDQLREEFPEYALPWHLERTVAVERDTPGVFAVSLYEDQFTGGAHGAHTLLYRNYRPGSGRLIELADILVEDGVAELTVIAEGLFRRQKQLAPETSLEEAGFWFDDGAFALNDNFLAADDGLMFRYNEYEIAPYASGATDLLVPYAAFAHLLRPDAAAR
jgi:hypothetical protein